LIEYEHEGGAIGTCTAVSLEIEDVFTPKKTASLCIEGHALRNRHNEQENLRYLRGIIDALSLPSYLQVMGYVEYMDLLVQ
jgi:hypothetical protein